jgi:hypothetical protein
MSGREAASAARAWPELPIRTDPAHIYTDMVSSLDFGRSALENGMAGERRLTGKQQQTIRPKL